MLRFNANLFRLAFTCASNEEARYYLKGVFVEPHAQGGVTLTATDGHRLICIRDESGQADESAIINLGDALKHCKAKHGERRDVVISTDSKDATIVRTIVYPARDEKTNAVIPNEMVVEDTPLAMAYGVRIDGSFPDYRRVVPQVFDGKNAPSFQGKYLADFASLAGEIAAHTGWKAPRSNSIIDRKDTIRVIAAEDERPNSCPALVLSPSFDFAFGVIMPCSLPRDAETRTPAWFRLTAAPLAQTAE